MNGNFSELNLNCASNEIGRIVEDNISRKYAPTTFERAIPSNKDGLIEVTRKILYCIYANKFYGGEKEYKSTKIVGDVTANYHPHGDSSVYSSLVEIAQWFSTSYPYVTANCNFGNLLGDDPAHARYTDTKGTKFLMDVIFEDISPKTIDFKPNFDNSKEEPVYLPTRIPLVLVNGLFSGIAVAFTSNIPPHNLEDVCNMCIKYISNNNIKLEDLVDGVYPDYPTGPIISNPEEIEKFYKYGIPTTIKTRADIEIDRDRNEIIIHSLPHKVYWNEVVSKVINLTSKNNNNKPHPILSKIKGIFHEYDNKNKKYTFRFEVSKDANIYEVVEHLYKSTPLTRSMQMAFILNYGNKVKEVNIKEIIASWYEVRRDVFRRTNISKKNELEIDNHRLEGLISIFPKIKDLVSLISNSTCTKEELINEIVDNFKPLTRNQASSIIEMQLFSLSRTSLNSLKEKLERNKEKIKEYEWNLSHEKECIIKDIEELKEKYKVPRRSPIEFNKKINIESLNITGSIIYSKNSYGLFNLVHLSQAKNLLNGLKTIKIDGKNYKEVLGSVEIKNPLKALIIFQENGNVRRVNISEVPHQNVWYEYTKDTDSFIKFVMPVYDENDELLIVSDNKLRRTKVSEFNTNKRNIGSYSLVMPLEGKEHLILMDKETYYIFIEYFKDEVPLLSAKSTGVKTSFINEITLGLEYDSEIAPNIILNIFDERNSLTSIFDYMDLTNKGDKNRKARKLIKDLNPNLGTVEFIGSVDFEKKNTNIIFINSENIIKIDVRNLAKNNVRNVPSKIKGILQISK